MSVGEPSSASQSVSLTTFERLRLRDPQAWARLSQMFCPLVLRWVVRAGVKPDDAPDVVQEVFRAVLVRIDDFQRQQPGSSFRGWLFGITRHKLLSHWARNRGPRAIGGSEARELFEQVAVAADASTTGDETELAVICRGAMQCVRDEFNAVAWQAFIETVLEDRAPIEVARELGVTVNSVYLAKSRILRRLRDEIGALNPDVLQSRERNGNSKTRATDDEV